MVVHEIRLIHDTTSVRESFGSLEPVLFSVRKGISGAKYSKFQIHLEDIPVYMAYSTVNQMPDRSIHSMRIPKLPVIPMSHLMNTKKKAKLSNAEARRIAESSIGLRKADIECSECEVQIQMWYRHDGSYRLVWRVVIAAIEPLGDYEVLVCAESGEILLVSDKLRLINQKTSYTGVGVGNLFWPNPIQSVSAS